SMLFLRSTVLLQEAALFLWYRALSISRCFWPICASCSFVMGGSLPSFRCSRSISSYSWRTASPFDSAATFTYGSGRAEVTRASRGGSGGGGGGISGALNAAFRRRNSSGPSSRSRVLRAHISRNGLYLVSIVLNLNHS